MAQLRGDARHAVPNSAGLGPAGLKSGVNVFMQSRILRKITTELVKLSRNSVVHHVCFKVEWLIILNHTPHTD